MRVCLYWAKVPGRIIRVHNSQTYPSLPLIWCFNKRAVDGRWCSSSLTWQISCARKQDSGSIRHPSRTCSFVPQLLASSQVQSDSLYSSQKTKAAPPLLCENSAWRCGWLCRSLIVQATGERENGMAASLQDIAREGRDELVWATLLSLSLPLFLLLFHSLP